jgi:hypothetical protein
MREKGFQLLPVVKKIKKKRKTKRRGKEGIKR